MLLPGASRWVGALLQVAGVSSLLVGASPLGKGPASCSWDGKKKQKLESYRYSFAAVHLYIKYNYG